MSASPWRRAISPSRLPTEDAAIWWPPGFSSSSSARSWSAKSSLPNATVSCRCARIGGDEHVDREGIGGRTIELLGVVACGPFPRGLHQTDSLKGLDVVADPSRMPAEIAAQTRDGRRTAHESAQQRQAMLVGERREFILPVDDSEGLHCASLSLRLVCGHPLYGDAGRTVNGAGRVATLLDDRASSIRAYAANRWPAVATPPRCTPTTTSSHAASRTTNPTSARSGSPRRSRTS